MNLSQKIKARAKELGFQKVGISPARPLEARNFLFEWLARGYNGEMRWIEKNADKRADPRRVLTDARSVISVAMNYFTEDKPSYQPTSGRISRYAWGTDYHEVLEKKLRSLYEYILSLDETVKGKVYVDTGPVMEKALAQRAGLGAIGKHTNLITKEYGSWVFLGEVILNIPLDYDEPMLEDLCGHCTLCIEACPTGAIVEPYVLDARRCISYLSIELRSSVPENLRPLMENMVFGCDICQEVCPWNQYAVVSGEADFRPREQNKRPALKQLLKLSLETFRSWFRHSPVKRAKWRGFLRNVAIALGNSKDPEAVPSLIWALSHEEPLVRAHAAWALRNLDPASARTHLEKAFASERDDLVRQEISQALRTL